VDCFAPLAMTLICPTWKAKYFCERGWTLVEIHQGAEVICPSANHFKPPEASAYSQIDWCGLTNVRYAPIAIEFRIAAK